jgi:ethanolamine utilization protein EutN
MKIAKVVGQVWATKRRSDLPSGALVEVQRIPAGVREVAWDPIGCGEGERVLYVTGGSARKGHKDGNPLCDCLVVAVLDDDSPGGAK